MPPKSPKAPKEVPQHPEAAPMPTAPVVDEIEVVLPPEVAVDPREAETRKLPALPDLPKSNAKRVYRMPDGAICEDY